MAADEVNVSIEKDVASALGDLYLKFLISKGETREREIKIAALTEQVAELKAELSRRDAALDEACKAPPPEESAKTGEA